MSRNSLVVVTLALICGLAAAVGVIAFVNTIAASARNVDTVQVVVATADIPCHSKLTDKDLVTQSLPRNRLIEGAQTRLEDVLNKYTNRDLKKNETILASGLDAQLVPAGWCQAFLNPPPASAASLRSGDRVDVFFSSGKGIGVKILDNVEVLTMDKEKGLSLKVRPEEAGELARGEGRFHLARRNPNDPYAPVIKAPLHPPLEAKKEAPKSLLSKLTPTPPEKGPGIVILKGINQTHTEIAPPAAAPPPDLDTPEPEPEKE